MLSVMTHDEIEQLLLRGVVGRIGCHAEGRTYVVPIRYAYDGECVYAQSAEGLKLRTMRSNPNVCFEVDDIEEPARWSSVMAWGTYDESVECRKSARRLSGCPGSDRSAPAPRR